MTWLEQDLSENPKRASGLHCSTVVYILGFQTVPAAKHERLNSRARPETCCHFLPCSEGLLCSSGSRPFLFLVSLMPRNKQNRKGKRDSKHKRSRRKSSRSSSYSEDGPEMQEIIKVAAAFGLTLNQQHVCQGGHAKGNCCSTFRLAELRKPKQLLISGKVVNLADLSSPLLATCLAGLTPQVTEASLMRLGGELLQA